MEDGQALARWAAGDTMVGEALFERHSRALYRFFRNKVDSGADDLIQATFLACLESAATFEGRSSFRAFMFGVARNVLHNHLRRERLEAEHIDFASVSVGDLSPRPSALLAANSERQVLLQALRALPVDLQILLELHYWEALSSREIGEALQLPAGTVRSRIRKAKQLLAAQVEAVTAGEAILRRTASNLDGWASAIRERWRADAAS